MHWSSDPFGDYLNATGSAGDATEQHFTGKERDAETGFANGNDYFGARYYSSSTGRFLSPDWSAKEEPVPYAKLDDPQSLDLYSYTMNNPLSNTDADGHQSPAPKQVTVAGKRFLISNGTVQGVVGEHYTQRQKNWLGGCPLSSCHTFNGDFAPLKPVYMTTVSAQLPAFLLGALQLARTQSIPSPPKLPEFDGKVSYGMLYTSEGDAVPLRSGRGAFPNYAASGHVEGQAALYIRESGSSGGVVYHNNTNGTCGYCNTQLSTFLSEGAELEVVPPSNSVPNNSRAVAVPRTYTGNSNSPKPQQ